MIRRHRWLIGWLVLSVLMVVALTALPWTAVLASVRRADPLWLAAAVAANGSLLLLSAREWCILLPQMRQVAYPRMLWIHAITSTVSNGGPFLAGHATGVHLLATRGGVGHATAVSVKALEQLMEGLAKLALLGVTLALVPLPDAVRAASLVLVLGVPLLALGLLLAAHRAHRLDDWARDRPGRAGDAIRFALEVARQLEGLRRPVAFAHALVLALARKVLEGAAIWAVAAALGVPLPLWTVALALTAVALSTMASVTPANVGIYEGSALLAYRAAGLDVDTGLALAVVQHAAYLLPMAGAGWVTLAFSGGARSVLTRTLPDPGVVGGPAIVGRSGAGAQRQGDPQGQPPDDQSDGHPGHGVDGVVEPAVHRSEGQERRDRHHDPGLDHPETRGHDGLDHGHGHVGAGERGAP